jgi:signal transduction histidine kinase
MAVFSDIVALARAVCATPMSLLSLDDGVWCSGSTDTDRVAALCRIASREAPSGFFETRVESTWCAGVVLLTSRGEVLGRLCVLDDQPHAPLTEEQRELLRAVGNQVVEQSELRRASGHGVRLRPLGHLAGGIAHDMNNALQTIVGALNTVEKLIETDNLERTPRFIAAALRSAQRGGDLSRNLQRLARRKLDGTNSVELNSLVLSLEDLLQRVCGERATLQLRLSDSPEVVACDPGDLESVLLTLVINAVESNSENGVITVSTQGTRVGVTGLRSFEWGFAEEFARLCEGTARLENQTVWIDLPAQKS